MLEGIKQKTPSLTSIVGMVVAVIVVLLAYGAWQVIWPTLGVGKLELKDLSGRLVYSGKLESEIAPKTYSLNLTNGSMQVVNESERFGFFSTSAIEFSSAENDSNFFFRAVAVDNTSGTTTLVKRVVHAVLPDQVKVLAQESTDQYGTMSWSESSKMLARSVVGETVSGTERAITSNWKTLISNEAGEVQSEIPDAAHPTWMPNSDVLLYLRSDGIYAYDMDVGAELRLISFLERGEVFTSVIGIMFEVSPDGRRLVVTTPGRGNVSVYEVTATMDVTKLYSRDNDSVSYSWPVVSPDGMSYAVIARDIVNEALANPRIEFYAMDNDRQEVIATQSLADFDPTLVYLDDWIK
ncbi:hypothetical protein A2837_03160 [Candidatus Kaiserbacteria bacterium RIFCSPHIGHO2_01_FULL_46_22]|uniref:Dipeptidylpeptidase IV N-terminal domain-containing protein n=1 Tax=Candidatus Kaiserbacteria bacterium RIFCSPHIGHO2_01_FULL_46_22 TaxID=1798475 RepID=A0A1F6BX51_9BACT|nr:MAG: hypothetical protein A2837_03160 [Candidatus Kaiserbacteria bacterium RIFCSPHIGHO2_01_FULL_46_22]